MAIIISEQQTNRLAKLHNEQFFLLESYAPELQEQPDALKKIRIFKVSGSTRSVYTTSLYKSGKMFCDCPDMKSHAKRHGVVCKHICFIIRRVLKYRLDAFFCNGCQFQREEIDTINEDLQAVTGEAEENEGVVDDELVRLYQALKLGKDQFALVKELTAEDECPICYLSFNATDTVRLCACPTCHNPIHRECVNKWLQHSPMKTCVYCRSPAWATFGNEKEGRYLQL